MKKSAERLSLAISCPAATVNSPCEQILSVLRIYFLRRLARLTFCPGERPNHGR
jgi:hypothetical protein